MFKTLAVLLSLTAMDMQKVGFAKLSWMFWDAYEITLFANNGYDPAKPFALELEYKMDFSGVEIAERSVDEIKNQNFASEEELQKWLEEMKKVFPDVKEGDKLKGLAANGVSTFYFNGSETGKIEDPRFTKAFFDIWLGKKTSEPELRDKLLAGE